MLTAFRILQAAAQASRARRCDQLRSTIMTEMPMTRQLTAELNLRVDGALLNLQ